jgi:hypothetical protein
MEHCLGRSKNLLRLKGKSKKKRCFRICSKSKKKLNGRALITRAHVTGCTAAPEKHPLDQAILAEKNDKK